MGLLEQVTQMKSQGKSEEEITQELQQKGIAPKSINDAISQSQIKNAVSGNTNMDEYEAPTYESPEIAPPEPMANSREGTYAPRSQEIDAQPQDSQEYAQQPQDQYQEGYYQQDPYQQPVGYSSSSAESYSDNVVEVAEQVFSEKIKKVQKQLDVLTEFKTLADTKIETISSRLKRIEAVMDKLQIEILEKIGSYGRNLLGIEKEMGMMQDSFGKMISSKSKTPQTHSHLPTLSHPTHKPKRKPVKRKTSKRK